MMECVRLPFGTAASGEEVGLWRITAADGSCAEFLDYGCALRSLTVCGRDGTLTDVCLGYETLAEYEHNDGCMGAVVGRFANRIGGASFELDGVRYLLAKNDGENHLHGGPRGFDKRVWQAETAGEALTFSRVSPHGEEGYPGTLQVRVACGWDGRRLSLRYRAETDLPTVLNLTNHSYFNLAGGGNILSHRLEIDADAFTENDGCCLPTGRILPVEGTPLDFRTPQTVGQRIDSADDTVRRSRGYDINYVLRPGRTLRRVAVVSAPETGLGMEVHTTLPGMQLYTANFLSPRAGKYGMAYERRSGLCLETQNFPDAMAHPNFPCCILRPGEIYESETDYVFFTE